MRRVLDAGRYILGAEGAGFEKEWAAYLGAAQAAGVASGTDAIELMLRALGIGCGDRVVIPSMAPVAVAAGVAQTGAEIVLADCDPQTLTLSPASLEAVLLSPAGCGVRAAVVVHLYGQVADWAALQAVALAHGIELLEDAAQAHGAEWQGRKAGTLGRAAAFSFYPTKNLGAMGDAGAVVTSDEVLADRVRSLRQYGWRERNISETEGLNSRLDEIQAAILRVKLGTLEEGLQARRRLAEHYSQRLDGMGTLARPPVEMGGTRHGWHLYVVRSSRRDALKSFLLARGVPVAVHYPAAIHQQPAYAGKVLAPGPLVETERAVAEVLSLPLHPYLPPKAVELVCDLIESF